MLLPSSPLCPFWLLCGELPCSGFIPNSACSRDLRQIRSLSLQTGNLLSTGSVFPSQTGSFPFPSHMETWMPASHTDLAVGLP
jgi:hypothetical protein